MAESKKNENIVIGLDFENRVIKVLKNRGKGFGNVQIEYLDLDPLLLENKSFFQVVDKIFQFYFAEENTANANIFVVLPDKEFVVDLVSIPAFSKQKSKEVLLAELKRSYPKISSYSITQTVVSKNKKSTLYAAWLADKEKIDAIVRVCKKNGLNLRGITHTSSAVVSAYFALATKPKQDRFMYLNLADKQSQVVCVENGKVVAFCTIPVGKNFLSAKNQAFLPKFVECKVAEKEVFDSKAQNDGTEYSSIFGLMADEEAERFEIYQKSHAREKIATERFLATLCSNQTILQTNFAVFARFLRQINESLRQYGLSNFVDVVVNLPQNLASAIQNQGENFRFVCVADQLAKNAIIADWFDLVGAIFLQKNSKNLTEKPKILPKKNAKGAT